MAVHQLHKKRMRQELQGFVLKRVGSAQCVDTSHTGAETQLGSAFFVDASVNLKRLFLHAPATRIARGEAR